MKFYQTQKYYVLVYKLEKWLLTGMKCYSHLKSNDHQNLGSKLATTVKLFDSTVLISKIGMMNSL